MACDGNHEEAQPCLDSECWQGGYTTRWRKAVERAFSVGFSAGWDADGVYPDGMPLSFAKQLETAWGKYRSSPDGPGTHGGEACCCTPSTPSGWNRVVPSGEGSGQICEKCGGTGRVAFCPCFEDKCEGCEDATCFTCHGTGKVTP